jgi:ubiquitin-protein ligase
MDAAQILKIELGKIGQYCPRGVYIVQSKDGIYKWNGIIFIKEGNYKNGIFRFDLEMNSNYPCSVPVIRMITPLFHPRVNQVDRKVDLQDLLEDSSKTWDVLKAFKNSLVFDCKEYLKSNVSNSEAKSVFMDREKGKIRAIASVQSSLEHLYDKVDSRIQF